MYKAGAPVSSWIVITCPFSPAGLSSVISSMGCPVSANSAMKLHALLSSNGRPTRGLFTWVGRQSQGISGERGTIRISFRRAKRAISLRSCSEQSGKSPHVTSSYSQLGCMYHLIHYLSTVRTVVHFRPPGVGDLFGALLDVDKIFLQQVDVPLRRSRAPGRPVGRGSLPGSEQKIAGRNFQPAIEFLI